MRPLDDFLAACRRAADAGALERIVVSGKRAGPPSLVEVRVRPVEVGGTRRLAFVERHATRDLTRHASVDDGIAEIAALLAPAAVPRFAHATLHDDEGRLELRVGKRGERAHLVRSHGEGDDETPADRAAHDRVRARRLPLALPFLAELGLVDAERRVVPAMARKWRQVDKFLEIVDHALDAARIAPGRVLRVADFGAGKGYLTFAVHAHLARRQGVAPEVTGVERRPELVDFCNAVARRTGADGLRFVCGDLSSVAPDALDLLIALHACDTATDQALALGVAAEARILIASPCCHRELRPQLARPEALRPLLRHGIHLGREAEMLTDTLRALALERAGYDAQVFEFVALEHTRQNKMITGVRREQTDPVQRDRARDEADALKRFYGVREQALETLLGVRPD